MSRSTRRSAGWLSAVTTAALVGAGLAGPLAGTALADVTAVDASPETQIVQQNGTASFTGAFTEDAPTNTVGIKVAYVSGSHGDGGNGVSASDATATVNQAQNTFTFSYSPTAPGTDVLRFFADNDADNILDPNEAYDEVSVTVAGAAFSVDLQPDTASAAVDTCKAYTVSTADEAGRPNPDRSVTVDISQPTEPGGGVPNVFFCDPNGSAASADPASQSPAYDSSTGATASSSRRLVVTTGAQGQPVTFGVGTTQPGTMTVVAFVDSNGNSAKDTAEPNDTSTQTWTPGRADSVTTVDAEPETGTAYQGQDVTFTVRLTNSAGDTVATVTPTIKITGANAQQIDCQDGAGNPSPSNNDGVASCTYNAANSGTDTIVAFVQQSDSTTPGPDSTEPQDTITRTITTGPASNLTVTITCTGTLANTTNACVNPTDDPTEVFTATVTGPDGSDADNLPDPAPGVTVDFTKTTGANTTDDDATLSPTSAVTGADGKATTTLTNPAPANGDSVTVTAAIRGQQDTDPITPGTQVSSDSATKQWATRTPTTLDLQPDTLTAQTNTTVTFTATVRDQFGSPVVGQNVDFVVENTPNLLDTDRTANNNTTAGLDRITDQNGQATFSFTDVGARNSSGNNQVTAWADTTENDTQDSGEPTDSSTVNWIDEPTTGNKVDIDVDGTCNPSTASPATDQNDARTVTFDDNPSDDAYPVCALVQNVNGTALAGNLVTFTINGVGTFVNSDGSAGGQQTTAYTDSSGIAHVNVRSNGEAGTQAITATSGNGTDTGTLTYKAAPAQARTISLTPPTSTVQPQGVVALTATVLDRFGNPVQGVTVAFSETGPGAFRSGGNPQNATTNAQGQASVEVTSTAAETGTETITATLDQASTDCERLAGDPAGAGAGNCTDSSTVTYQKPALKVTAPTSYYTTVPGGGAVTFSGTGGDAGETLVVHRKVGNGSYTTFSGPVVASDGTWSYRLGVSTTTAVFFSGNNGQTAVKVVKTTLNITFPSTYYYSVAKGQRTALYGSGARPGDVLEIWTKSGSQRDFVKRTNTVTATYYGTWALRFNVYQPMAIYFRNSAGKSDTVVYRVQ